MKPYLLLISLLLLLDGFAHKSDEAAPKKRALIVAISEYAPGTGWRKINSSNDVEVVRNALLLQGFSEKDIFVLQEEQATKQGIQQTFAAHFAPLRKGDFAFFHFSGHGQQLPDKNGDEFDGKDEALVPYDAYEKYGINGYKGEKHLIDDEVKVMLDKLRKQLGPSGQVLVTLDACHSGTGTRAPHELGVARGSIHMMATEEEEVLLRKRNSDDSFFIAENEKDDPSLAPLVLFSATLQDGLNHEIVPHGLSQSYGPLSYAFSKAFPLANEQTSYQALYDEMKIFMGGFFNPRIPAAEGNLNQIIFGGTLKEEGKHYNVFKTNEQYVEINAGTFAGLLPGTELFFYPPDTWKPEAAKVLSKGTITKSYLFSATVKIEKGNATDLLNTWAYVESLHFGQLEIGIHLDIDDVFFSKKMEEQLALVVNFKSSSIDPDIIIRQKGNEPIEVFTAKGFDLTPNDMQTLPAKNKATLILDKALLPFATTEYLRFFSVKDDFIKVGMELIPLIKNKNANTEKDQWLTGDLNSKKENGNIVFDEGDKIRIKVSNYGEEKAYFCIYDIQPDNKVTVLIPGKNRPSEEYFLEGGTSVVLDHQWTINKPYGMEVFKLIALNQPVDILQAYTRAGAVVLPNPPTKGGNRSSNLLNQNLPSNIANVESIVFMIRPKNNSEND